MYPEVTTITVGTIAHSLAHRVPVLAGQNAAGYHLGGRRSDMCATYSLR